MMDLDEAHRHPSGSISPSVCARTSRESSGLADAPFHALIATAGPSDRGKRTRLRPIRDAIAAKHAPDSIRADACRWAQAEVRRAWSGRSPSRELTSQRRAPIGMKATVAERSAGPRRLVRAAAQGSALHLSEQKEQRAVRITAAPFSQSRREFGARRAPNLVTPSRLPVGLLGARTSRIDEHV